MLAEKMRRELGIILAKMLQEQLGEFFMRQDELKESGLNGPELLKQTSHWSKDFADFVKKFESISDYDAVDVIPGLSDLFVTISSIVLSPRVDEAQAYQALLKLSSMRKQLGIDKRMREISKSPITWFN